MVGEEVEEIVPGDPGSHRIDVKGGKLGHRLRHQGVADARPGVAGIDADGVDDRRRLGRLGRAELAIIDRRRADPLRQRSVARAAPAARQAGGAQLKRT